MFRVKKDEALKRNLLRRLYGIDEDNQEKDTSPKPKERIRQVVQHTEKSSISNTSPNDKVYSVTPAPPGYTAESVINNTPLEESETESDSSEECVVTKRRRKRHRKKKHVDINDDKKVDHAETNLEEILDSKLEQTPKITQTSLNLHTCISHTEKSDSVVGGYTCNSNSFTDKLSKNQKRKLKKKRRKEKGNTTPVVKEAFIYIDRKKEKDEKEQQKNKELELQKIVGKIQDVKDFVDAVWDIYVREEEFLERSIMDKRKLKTKFDKWMSDHEEELDKNEPFHHIVENLHRIKSVCILNNTEQTHDMLDKLRNDCSDTELMPDMVNFFCEMVEYWFSSIVK